jgi:ABC-type polysaccharide/polyol phosphate export permease
VVRHVITAHGLAGRLPEVLAEQYEYRELLRQMVRRDLLIRYKQTVMGFGWAVFMPLINTAVFSVVFTRLAPMDVGMPYPLYAFCGLLTWNFFASALRFSVTALTGNPSLVTKVYFPREIFPFAAVFVSFVDLVVASTVLIGLMIYYGTGVSAALLALPAVIVVHVAFTAAMALLLSVGNLFYRDVKYLFEVLITVWMFASSALYPVAAVGGALAGVLALNPMTHIIDAYRDVLLLHRAPSMAFAATAAASSLLLAGIWILFHRAESHFAENL